MIWLTYQGRISALSTLPTLLVTITLAARATALPTIQPRNEDFFSKGMQIAACEA
jgi:hypothetical protein